MNRAVPVCWSRRHPGRAGTIWSTDTQRDATRWRSNRYRRLYWSGDVTMGVYNYAENPPSLATPALVSYRLPARGVVV